MTLDNIRAIQRGGKADTWMQIFWQDGQSNVCFQNYTWKNWRTHFTPSSWGCPGQKAKGKRNHTAPTRMRGAGFPLQSISAVRQSSHLYLCKLKMTPLMLTKSFQICTPVSKINSWDRATSTKQKHFCEELILQRQSTFPISLHSVNTS